MNGAITLFESAGGVLAKRWRLDDAGELKKETGAQLSRGTFRVVEFASATELAELLTQVSTREALCTSLPLDGSSTGRVCTRARPEPDALTRTKDDFGFHQRPGLLFIDHDTGGTLREELWQMLCAAMPALEAAGVVWRPSGSSHVHNGNQDLTGLRGQHLFVMIQDASDGPRVLKTLDARLWLAGQGRVVVSASGSLLLRSPVDVAVADAARLIFAGGSEATPPLTQRRGPPVILAEGGFLDTRTEVPDLTPDELGRYEAMVAEAKSAAMPEAQRKRAEHRSATIREGLTPLMQRERIDAATAEQRLGEAVDAAYAGVLLGDFRLTLVHDAGRQEVITVSAVLRDRQKYHEADCLDPLNPQHRGGAADCRLYLLGSSPCAFSFDSGVYRLRMAKARIVVSQGNRGELVERLARLIEEDPRVFLLGGQPVVVDSGRVVSLTTERLMLMIGTAAALVVKAGRGQERLTDVPREVAGLVRVALQ